jgi:hypothetical protein
VEFAVELVLDANRTRIWEKVLDPDHRKDDTGEQVAIIAISQAGKRLVLTTRSSDQSVNQRSYWSGIQFH